MDVLITYVDGNDPLWQEDYRKTVNETALVKRYRDMGTLRYLFRGLECCMPFVRKVHLLVARDSQVPSWVNREEVQIVTHAEVIPRDRLPMFNSSSIEMFLQCVPSLEEQFLYLNDDSFPIGPCTLEDFFRDGRVIKGYGRHMFAPSAFRRLCRRSDRLAREAARVRAGLTFLRPQHTCSPMLRSVSDEAYRKMEPEILQSLTPLRGETNFNQYYFLDYYLFTGRAVNRRFPAKYFSLAFTKPAVIARMIEQPGDIKMLCINDAKVSEEVYEQSRAYILSAFERRFPKKSKFEL